MKSRYEWLLGCAVIAAAGGVAVALDEGTSAPQAAAPKPDPAVEAWVAVLSPKITDANEIVRRSAVHALVAVGPDALPALGKLAASDDAKTAGTAMDLIAAIKHGPGEHRGQGGPGGPPPMGGKGGPGMGPGGPGGPPPMGGPHGMRGGPGGPGGPDRMFEALGLSDEQKTKVQEVFKATHEKIRQETEAELQKILTPEQWQKFQEAHKPQQNGPQDPGAGPGR
jgi:Spy/CpxP family protein refolding chaperone